VGGESATTVEPTWSSKDERARSAIARLAAALGPRSGHVVVTASSSEAAEALVWRVEAAIVSYRCGWLDGAALDAAHLLRAVGAEDAEPRALPATMQALLADAGAIGRPLVVIVRAADTATPSSLEELRLMLEGGAPTLETVRLVLLGGPGLLETLRQPMLRALASRVTSVITAPEDPLSTSLEVTSSVLSERARRTEARSRWPHPWRIAGAGLLGALLAGAVFSLVLPTGAPPPPLIAAVPTVAPVAPAPPLEPAPSPPSVPSPTPIVAPVSPDPALHSQTRPAEMPETVMPAPAPAPRPVPAAIVHPPAPSRVRGRSVQVAAFRDPARATALRDELAKHFDWVMVTRVERDGVVWNRVRIEGLESAAAVDAALAALRRSGHQPIVVRD
jgi:hypothetical protein